jgi:hypothetical protein
VPSGLSFHSPSSSPISAHGFLILPVSLLPLGLHVSIPSAFLSHDFDYSITEFSFIREFVQFKFVRMTHFLSLSLLVQSSSCISLFFIKRRMLNDLPHVKATVIILEISVTAKEASFSVQQTCYLCRIYHLYIPHKQQLSPACLLLLY